MRAHLLLLAAGQSWPLDDGADNRIGVAPYADVAPPGIRRRVAAVVRFQRGAWRAFEGGGVVRVMRRGRAMVLDTALVDGDVIEVDGVPLVLEIEDEDRDEVAGATVFVVMPNGFALRLEPGERASVGDGPMFDAKVRLGREGAGCMVFDEGGVWFVGPVGATPVAVLRDGVREEVRERAPISGGAVIEIDEQVQIELLDPRALAAPTPAPAAPPHALDDDTAPHVLNEALAADDDIARAPRRTPTRKLVIEELPHGVFLWTDAGSVGVDATEHDLCLHFEGGRVDRFGATRAGLQAALEHIEQLLRPRPLSDALHGSVRDALMGALRRTASADPTHAALVNEAEVRVADIDATPLVLARGVLAQRYLLADVPRFAPCAVALASIENDPTTDADTPERAEVWADQLARWRELYVAPGSSPRSVNKALTDFSDDVHPRTLWGLRKVRLGSPLRSRAHMQLLCALGAHAYTRGPILDERIAELVLSASEAEIGEALVILDEGELDAIRAHVETPAEVLASLVLTTELGEVEHVFRRRPRFADVFAVALQNLKTPLRTETLTPPIALPRVPGLSFLSSVAALMEEGRAMMHCAALYGPRAVAGESYLFHYEEDRDAATIEVATDGTVLQSRGPGNTKNVASRNAERILTRWGRALRLTRLGPMSLSLWPSGGPAPTVTFEPIRTLGELIHIYRSYVSETDDLFDLIIDWCVASARYALEGHTWLAMGHRWPGDHIVRLDAGGAVVGSTESALAQTLTLGRGDEVRRG